MALVPNLVFGSVSADGTLSTLSDSTVYGTPNPNRNQVATYLTAYKVDEDLVESALVVDTFDPETVTSFTVTNVVDGRYRFKFVIVDYWSSTPVYDRYDLVWDPAQNKFYEYVNTTPSPGGGSNPVVTDINYWAEVADPTSKIANVGTATEADNLLYQILEKIIDFQTAKCYADIAIAVAKEGCVQDCSCKNKTVKARDRAHSLLSLMRIADTRQLYLQGERWAREAEKLCSECGCIEA
jgi:hypothetical protein